MKKYFLVGIMILCSMIWATNARAYPITLAEVGVTPGQIIDVHLSSFYSGGVYVGAYELTIDGVPISSYCIDYLHFNPGVATTYDLIPLLNGTKFSSPEQLKYKQAAYIMQNYNPNNPATTNDQRVNAQLAIWEILSPDAGSLGTGDFYVNQNWSGDAQAIVTQVLGLDLGGFDTLGFNIAYNEGSQDYMVPVPEPTSILLLGFGLIGVAVLRRRLKK